jgi:hypothetical protein
MLLVQGGGAMTALGHYASLGLHDLVLVLGVALGVSVAAEVLNAVSYDLDLHWSSIGLGTTLGLIIFPFLCAGGWIVAAIRWHSLAQALIGLLAAVPGAFLGMGVVFLCALVVQALITRVLGTA